ncbi:hypothetical protein QJS04_geneDACA013961 [Acorus gramineus]|uniref:Uncharacterized protein n=1 Tax=Acorus gramineus TaxID=55184 RepID=A0AAV9AUY0_ACOGR|nr:hypothetical protein QJS04_geneDACA013961 [Acorus gramineus]
MDPSRNKERSVKDLLMAEASGSHPSEGPSSLPKPSLGEGSSKSQVPALSSFRPPNADHQMFPIMYPSFVPQEQGDRGAGLYAVLVPPLGSMAGLYSNTLIPLTYNIPTRPAPTETVGQEQGQEARQQHPRQRQIVVRRFQFEFQLDLLLILKLAAVVFVFNQDGSRQRLLLLLLSASIVYLDIFSASEMPNQWVDCMVNSSKHGWIHRYQTGVLAPLMQWLRRAGAPTPPPPRVVRAENAPPVVQEDANAPRPERNGGVENENPPPENGDRAAEEGHWEEAGAREENNRVRWWGLAKEIQMFVIGFITSLLPGFDHHHHD